MYQNILADYVAAVKSEGRYREFVGLTRIAGSFPYAINQRNGEKIILWCINDYLGMSQNSSVLTAAKQAISESGVGSGGTRNIGGNNTALLELEQTIADLHNKEKALVFTSGYVANDATLVALARIIPGIVYFSDKLNHASIIAGIRNSRAEKYIYNHNDMASLEEGLKQYPFEQPKLIVFESVYSMDGAVAPIEDIVRLSKKYNALTYIDEVHSVGLYGDKGAGIAAEFKMNQHIDIIQGTLAKAYGAIGGYISGSEVLIDAVRCSAPGFIFTTSLPPVIAAAANASIKYLKDSSSERILLQERVAKLKRSLHEAGIKYMHNESHIVPILIGDANLVKTISTMLLAEYGVYVQHINFPTVPRGTERLRVIVTPYHTNAMITGLVESLTAVFTRLGVKMEQAA